MLTREAASIPDDIFEERMASAMAADADLTSADFLRLARSLRHQQRD